VPLFQEQLLRMAMVAAGFTGGQAEELRRAMGFKRSETRMKQIEVTAARGDGAQRHHRRRRRNRIITRFASFALYGFPRVARRELRAAGLCERLSQVQYRPRSTRRCSTTSRWGFTTRRRWSKTPSAAASGSIRSTCMISGWDCTCRADGAIRLGRRYVHVLRETGRPGDCRAKALAERVPQSISNLQSEVAQTVERCPKCGCDDQSMLEPVDATKWFCNNCSHDWRLARRKAALAFASLDDLVARASLRRDEVVTLADVGALNAFGYDRRSALWQAERAVRPSGDLFKTETAEHAENAEIFVENESLRSADSAFESSGHPSCRGMRLNVISTTKPNAP
jgi:error-prone DNA polymerase